MPKNIIPAGKFKAQCLQLMNKVKENHISYIITKHGNPIAKLVPIEQEKSIDPFGCLKGTITLLGDIIEPIDVKWETNE